MSIDLAELVFDTLPGGVLTLPAGTYDATNPVLINMDMTITGSRDAVVNSEFQIASGANVRFQGFTLEMNKTGAAMHTGVFQPMPQNGMVVVRNGSLFTADNLEWKTQSGYDKPALHVQGQANAYVRAINRFSRIDWRGSNADYVVEVLYGGVVYLLGWPTTIGPDNEESWLNIPCTPNLAAVSLVNSQLVMSGANISKWGGDATCGISAARNSYAQIGAGFSTSVMNFVYNDEPRPTFCDETSHKWVAPGCIG